MSWHAELPHQHYVERRLQRTSHLVPHRDATAGQREYEQIGTTGVMLEYGGQASAGFEAIPKSRPDHIFSAMDIAVASRRM
jgi:hypothetical protein